MAVIKCKMCGGDLLITGNERYGTCVYCGTAMTLPDVMDAQSENLFMRAEQFRHMKQFDKALEVYLQIIELRPSDAEAHFGALLSRYGIEYVEDPVSHKRIPTCHRVQETPVTKDSDYLAAVSCARDPYAAELYEKEVQRIFEIQKDILAISAAEAPYDVFICYKESTEGGLRTKDSIAAQEVYDALTDAGLKVFFARITLEGKLGTAYEPVIFAALNSSRVMLVVGTAPEFVNAVWVRNEWTRFLAMMTKDPSKVIIPCYHGMNPYSFPEELKMFQAQDMTKIGFMQDLVSGIQTVLAKAAEAAGVEEEKVVNQEEIRQWLLEANEAVLNGRFAESALLTDKILGEEPENAWAMMIKIMAEKQVSSCSMLSEDDLKGHPAFPQLIRYADEDLTFSIVENLSFGANKYYFEEDEAVYGPYSEEEMSVLLSNGTVTEDMNIFTDAKGNNIVKHSIFKVTEKKDEKSLQQENASGKNKKNDSKNKKKGTSKTSLSSVGAVMKKVVVFGMILAAAYYGYTIYIEKTNVYAKTDYQKRYPVKKFSNSFEKENACKLRKKEMLECLSKLFDYREQNKNNWLGNRTLMMELHESCLKYFSVSADSSREFTFLTSAAAFYAAEPAEAEKRLRALFEKQFRYLKARERKKQFDEFQRHQNWSNKISLEEAFEYYLPEKENERKKKQEQMEEDSGFSIKVTI